MAIRKCVVAVPARLQSSRLPNKVLADIGGQPMIQRVLERCRRARSVEAVVLCTDSTELKLSLIHISDPRDLSTSRMPSSA